MSTKTLQELFPKTKVHENLSPNDLMQQTLDLEQGVLSDNSALVVNTGAFTGRSPKDKYFAKDSITADTVDWNGFNHPIEEKYFDVLKEDVLAYLSEQKEIWSRDCFAGADPDYQLRIRVVNENPWSNLFAYNLFLRPDKEQTKTFDPEWQIFQAPGFYADPEKHGTRQGNFAVISFTHKIVLIGGTAYTGEIKKSVFSILNFILPHDYGMLGMHCSANMGKNGDTTLFFGLSGTGKTTLSADPERELIGDDEHGWAENGVFNFEGGCYAKVVNLSEEYEPDIFRAIRHGSLVENTQFFPGTKSINFEDISITENTRVSYPLDFIRNAKIPSVGGIPDNIFFLTCDAYGVFPPISRLTPEQARYYFISGYTAKVAGTEEGVKEPTTTFSACFGAPFLPLHPKTYAAILEKKIETYGVKVWLVNTGWSGGGYGVGSRIKLSYTRAMIRAALEGVLEKQSFVLHEQLGLSIPESCPGVPSEILNPINTWTDKEAYKESISSLLKKFDQNIQQYK